MISQMRFHASPHAAAAASLAAGLPRRPASGPARVLDTIARYATSLSRAKAGRMRYRPLGNSGLLVSVVGLGCNNFGRRLTSNRPARSSTRRSTAGVTLLDTADTYGGRGRSEEILGEVLAGPARAGRAGDQVRLSGRGHGLRPGRRRQGRPQVHQARRRAVAAPAADRLHRPVPDPHARTRSRRSRRRCQRSPSWSGPAWSATSATRTSPVPSSPERPERPASSTSRRSSRRRITGRCSSGRPSSSRPGRHRVRARRTALSSRSPTAC